jgi:thymidylate synthase ThyX
MYNAKILADSIANNVRLTTLEVVMPRIVLAEFNTHRVLSRNSASSRAIPVEKRIQSVKKNPFVPEAFGANQRGMQAGADLSRVKNVAARALWLASMHVACFIAGMLARVGVHKQWANRIIEPYCWHTVIVTATEWENFFALRLSKEAQPEIRRVAELMKQAMDASMPRKLQDGEWHLPMISVFDRLVTSDAVKVAVARCARVSYETHDTGKIDYHADTKLHDRLLSSGHMSPFEHVAYVDLRWADSAFSGNFRRPWVQYRKTLPNEDVFRG